MDRSINTVLLSECYLNVICCGGEGFLEWGDLIVGETTRGVETQPVTENKILFFNFVSLYNFI